jgi:hypothetical protein
VQQVLHPATLVDRSLAPGQELTARDTARLLERGIERFLKVLLAATAAPVLAGGTVPGGFCRRLQDALGRPTLGGLIEFLLWASGAGLTRELPRLEAFLASGGKGRSWLTELVQLRNTWQHPKEESPEVVLERARKLLQRSPEAFQSLAVVVESSGVSWSEERGGSALLPFVCVADDEVHVCSHLDRADGLCFSTPQPAATQSFQQLWVDVRATDALLEDPTPEDLRRKVSRLAAMKPGQAPWWLPSVTKPGAPGLLLEPGQLGPALAALPEHWSGAGVVLVELRPGESPMQALAARLGLASAPSAALLCAAATTAQPLILGFGARSVGSRDLLALLYWLADLREEARATPLRVLVERDASSLEADEHASRDRLPERLEEILRRPPRSRGFAPADFLWPAKARGFAWPWLR